MLGQDVDDAALAYALTDDAGGRFAIDGAGRITVANAQLLDFEQGASHTVVVRVTDASGLFFQKAFAIGVSDVNPEAVTGGGDSDTLCREELPPILSTAVAEMTSSSAEPALITLSEDLATTRRSGVRVTIL